MAMNPSTNVQSASIAFRAYATDLFAGTGQRALFRTFSEVFPAGTEYTQQLNVLEALPVIRKWVASREFPDAQFATVSATPEPYEKSFSENVEIANRSSGDALMARLTRWLGNPDRDFDKIVTEYMLSNPTGYDGVALFASNHPRGPAGATTQSNTSTTALSGPQHRAAMVVGSTLRDETGESFEIQYDALMVGPALAALAREITGSTRRFALNAAGAEATASVVAATTAPNFGDLTVYDGGEVMVVVNPRFVGTYANYYLYVDSTKGAKPIAVFQGETSVTERTSPDSEPVFTRNVYEWGVKHVLTLLPGAWQTAYLGIV
ncbi:MAG: Mu-like prophage major head subunit gpT family protein [Gemmatimonadaceae bacterium]|nr:Mu-like prophage major head subunit gpT family protein [Gemmatimonadaceae bacterium]